jgi:hypothetical protein
MSNTGEILHIDYSFVLMGIQLKKSNNVCCSYGKGIGQEAILIMMAFVVEKIQDSHFQR